jgi:hypothetical protein
VELKLIRYYNSNMEKKSNACEIMKAPRNQILVTTIGLLESAMISLISDGLIAR